MLSQYPGWEFAEELGGGSFGKVYKAKKIDSFGKDIYSAVKVLTIPEEKSEVAAYRDDGYDDASIKSLLQNRVEAIAAEFELLSKLRGNTNVVSYEDHAIIPHVDGLGWDIYIRMELLTALPNYMQRQFGGGTPDDKTVIKLGIDLCKALELCQKHNIIHRDIKPQNIFINDNGDFKLGDFGIAKTSDHATRATKTGTYTYMAPEVYKDMPYHHHVDIYSLGLVLYWMLNERRGPFLALPPETPRAKDMEDALARRMAGQTLPAPKYGSDDLKRVVMKACSFQPRDRWANATEMREALEAVLAGRPLAIAPAVAPKNSPEGGTVRVQRPPVAPQAPIAPQVQQSPMDATVGVRRAPVSQNNTDRQPVPPVARQPQKKKNKGWIFAVIAAVLAVAVLAGAGYWFFLRDDSPASGSYIPSISNPTTEPEITEEGSATEVPVENIYIPVMAKGFQHQYWQAVKAGADDAAADLGVEIYFDGPISETEIAAQVDIVKKEMAKNPQAMALAALDTSAVADILDECAEKGIPVVGFDSGVPNDTSGAVVATACTNNEAAATIAAEKFGENEALIEAMTNATTDAPVIIGCLSQDALSASVIGRTTGFVNKMKEVAAQYGTVAVTGHSTWAEGDEAAASIIIEVAVSATTEATDVQTAANALLAKENLVAVFCSNEGAVTGFLAAVSDGEDLADGAKYGDLVVAGFDAGAAQKNAVRQGWFYGSVTQDPYQMGYQAVALAVAAANGEPVADVDSGAQWYNAENIDDEMIALLVYD